MDLQFEDENSLLAKANTAEQFPISTRSGPFLSLLFLAINILTTFEPMKNIELINWQRLMKTD